MGRSRSVRLLIAAGRLVAAMALAIALALFWTGRSTPGDQGSPPSTAGDRGAAPSGAPARTPIARPSPTPAWIVGLAAVCLAMPAQAASVEPSPMLAAAERALGRRGVRVVTGAACDATLTLDVVFTPVSKHYTGLMGPSKDCYTGATVHGEIRLERPGTPPLSVPVDGSVKPSSGTISTCPGPAEAPFASLWPGLLLDGLSWLFGDEVLYEALDDPEPDVGSAAVRQLASTGWPGALDAVMGAMRDRAPEVRSAAARALGTMHPDTSEALAALVDALTDPDDMVRVAAVSALASIGNAAAPAVPALVRLMASSDGWFRTEVMRALGAIGPAAKTAVSALVPLLKDPDAQVRAGAAEALQGIGPSALEAVPALVEALADAEWFVRSDAERALEAITGERLGDAPGPWRTWWEARE